MLLQELLQQHTQAILLDNKAEKEANTLLVNEIDKLKNILEKGQHQYNVLLTKNADLENKVTPELYNDTVIHT